MNEEVDKRRCLFKLAPILGVPEILHRSRAPIHERPQGRHRCVLTMLLALAKHCKPPGSSKGGRHDNLKSGHSLLRYNGRKRSRVLIGTEDKSECDRRVE
ncbi:hypothetical protein PHLCEN_2v13147 [Hermanssonia centrifuga]|uniref:Uncharacterized protein n=1 Tax=Hermanssonia centrifuga TaxID=98765 RepID=A0A2R6NF80_9APHY|nr:hypothetical protein PHLCEN_2v13147 [Hermanssonia centrifuga]